MSSAAATEETLRATRGSSVSRSLGFFLASTYDGHSVQHHSNRRGGDIREPPGGIHPRTANGG